jgi:hypothetical protein
MSPQPSRTARSAPPAAPRPSRARHRLLLLAATVVAAVLIFLIGRWTAEPAPAPVARAPAVPEPQASAPVARDPMRPVAPAAVPPPAQSVPAAPAPPPRAAPAPVTPELATRVKTEATEQLELLRPEIVAQCWPRGGLPKGRTTASVTFNITFDAQGREIARGITEDRRAPAGEFARCLRQLPATALAIAPPGSNVGVSIPVSYP